jgi:hypothetical protein
LFPDLLVDENVDFSMTKRSFCNPNLFQGSVPRYQKPVILNRQRFCSCYPEPASVFSTPPRTDTGFVGVALNRCRFFRHRPELTEINDFGHPELVSGSLYFSIPLFQGLFFVSAFRFSASPCFSISQNTKNEDLTPFANTVS